MTVYYRNKVTGKIEAKYVGCDTNSMKFRDETKYERFASIEDLPIEIMPIPSPNPNQDIIDAVKLADTDKKQLKVLMEFVKRELGIKE